MTDYLDTDQGRRIAYNRQAGAGPGVVFLGGYRSDMGGTKALALAAWAGARGRAFLRLDYSGHGESSGAFEDGAIGDWRDDARAAILALTEGPQVLVGSSMGGWIALLLAREMPERVAALVTVAAAPDFTEDGFWARLDADARETLQREGRVRLPWDKAPEPHHVTRRLIEDGRQNLVLRSPLRLPFPVRFLQGSLDEEVPVEVAQRLFAHAEGDDIRLTLVKGADHRFSTPECLRLIEATLEDLPGI